MTATTVKRRSRSNFRNVDQLNAEWAALVDDSEHVLKRWRYEHVVFAGCGDLDDVLRTIRHEPDLALGELLAADAAGDMLAGRVVLQAMLGKTVRMAARDPQASVDDYVAALWLRIHGYPRHRRPNRIAANLALDTLKSVSGEHRWVRRGVSLTPVGSEALLDELGTGWLTRTSGDAASAVLELSALRVITAARQLGLLDDPSHDVLVTVYAEGLSGRDAAVRHQTTPEMVRYRCSRAIRRLAEHSAELLDAA